MRLMNLVCSVLLFSILSAYATETAAALPVSFATASTTAEKKAEEEKKGPWSAGASATYSAGFRADTDPYLTYELSTGYKFSETTSLSVVQSINHAQYIYSGEAELQAADTSVGLSRKISKDLYGTGASMSGRFGLTVPVSNYSKRADVLTKPGLIVKFSKLFLDKKLKIGLSLSGTYYVNRFKTTPTIEGAGGGRPLRHYIYGVSVSAGYKLTDKLSLSGSTGYTELKNEEVAYKNSYSALGLHNPAVHRYSFSLGGAYAATDKLSLSVSYGQDSQVEKMGGLEMALFDEMVTEWSVGASYSF